MNTDLLNLYQKKEPALQDFRQYCTQILDNQKITIMHSDVLDAYWATGKKIAIVGQEPGNWYLAEWEKQIPTVADSMGYTEDFLVNALHLEYAPKNKFFEFIHEYSSNVNGHNANSSQYSIDSVYWTNIFRLCTQKRDKSRKISDENVLYTQYIDQHQTLTTELAVVKPDIILFLTGPNYDRFIKMIYPDVSFTELSKTYDARKLARLYSKDLPQKTFRTYHPEYPGRYDTGLWEPIMQELCAYS
ncbi:MAG: hypothetical protein LBC55_07305 [Desulfovibrio sp.]|jgi:hypothetical protein|nr:hypothetical protein [Desulfovibrio sp.]